MNPIQSRVKDACSPHMQEDKNLESMEAINRRSTVAHTLLAHETWLTLSLQTLHCRGRQALLHFFKGEFELRWVSISVRKKLAFDSWYFWVRLKGIVL